MATVALTKDTFEETVTGNDIVLVDFWAEWCGPCRMFGPTFEKISEGHPDIVFGKVDTEAEQALGQMFQIMSIPTLMAIKEQIVIFSQAGALPEQALEELIAKVRELDMDKVRADMAANGEVREKS